ncbi:glycosyltransferase family 2 protein [Salinimicrobium sp. GXAS 041]|uniref:glycosyltransferase family 2 protein n=1 Tax=Salinimicrobium sp. GXAS 041 TaxID=3400806 RepID=UPI003C786A47
MKSSLIICTYQRPEPLKKLLDSVELQTILPDQILIIDGSEDDRTRTLVYENSFTNLEYYTVEENDRGLTRQRNFGVRKLQPDAEVAFFLDDDTILHPDYFKEILTTYEEYPEALGVSGHIINEQEWQQVPEGYQPTESEFVYDNWKRIEGSRFSLRRKFGLSPNVPPGFMPDFSHGYSTGFLPPSGKTYEVEMLMGGIASYKTEVFEKLQFSSYFEGYGLYEDADFALRASKMGKLYVNTAAKVEHHHAAEGRPNKFKYGKMVVRNGWYVWRVKNPHPTWLARTKWNATSFLLTVIRLSNVVNTRKRKEALTEASGRIAGWISLIFNKPKFNE